MAEEYKICYFNLLLFVLVVKLYLRCGLGSYYGTIGRPVPFFSAQSKPKEKYEPPGKNLYTNPGKKGTGYG